LRHFGREFVETNRLRTQGTDNLLASAQTTSCKRFIAQSYTGWPYERIGEWAKAEDAPLLSAPEPELRESLKAIVHLESSVLQQTSIEGVVLRYGTLYGPGTSLSPGGSLLEDIRRRRVPIIGGGTAHWSFLHIDDAARSTLDAVESSVSGLFNIADDEPAPISDWLSFLANVLGGKAPLRIPAWLGRIAVGPHGVAMMTEGRGALNAKAKAQIPLRLKWPSWRAGFRRGLGSTEEIPTSSVPDRFCEPTQIDRRRTKERLAPDKRCFPRI
jgi:nucleoside-diphosphate-sugar epimerase